MVNLGLVSGLDITQHNIYLISIVIFIEIFHQKLFSGKASDDELECEVVKIKFLTKMDDSIVRNGQPTVNI